MTTRPGRLPEFRFVLSPLSSNTKQLFARGNIVPAGNSSDIEALNWARMGDSESFAVHVAMPMTPRGKSDGLKSDNGV